MQTPFRNLFKATIIQVSVYLLFTCPTIFAEGPKGPLNKPACSKHLALFDLEDHNFPPRGLDLDFAQILKEDPVYANAILNKLMKTQTTIYLEGTSWGSGLEYYVGKIENVGDSLDNLSTIKISPKDYKSQQKLGISRILCLGGSQQDQPPLNFNHFPSPKIGEVAIFPPGGEYGILSPTEDFYTIGDKTYIVWTKGRNKGRIYDIVSKPIRKMPALPDFLKHIDHLLTAIGKIAQHTELSRHKELELLMELRTLYDGTSDQVGLSTARYYDPNINIVALELEHMGGKNWLRRRASALGIELEMVSYMKSYEETEQLDQYFLGTPLNQIPEDYSPDDPTVLMHGTYGVIFSSLINEGGLKADAFRDPGIPKLTGENSASGYSPHRVSFWYYPHGQPFAAGGYSSDQGFSFPITLGISQSRAQTLKLSRGTMSGELVIDRKVSWADLTDIFVPEFKIAEITRILHQHGITNIRVKPLRRGNRSLMLHYR